MNGLHGPYEHAEQRYLRIFDATHRARYVHGECEKDVEEAGMWGGDDDGRISPICALPVRFDIVETEAERERPTDAHYEALATHAPPLEGLRAQLFVRYAQNCDLRGDDRQSDDYGEENEADWKQDYRVYSDLCLKESFENWF